MNITLIHRKDKPVPSQEENLYVVVCRFDDGFWGFADFCDRRYTSDNYREAVKLKNEIYKRRRHDVWPKDSFCIAKITL